MIKTAAALAVITVATACNSTMSYVKCTQELADNWAAGNFAEAVEISEKLLDKQRCKVENNIVFFLEHASALRAVGAYEDSNWHFQTALDLMDERRGDLQGQNATGEKAASAGREVAALISNLNAIPYRGFGYDRIMAHTYIALNYLAMGENATKKIKAIIANEEITPEEKKEQIKELKKQAAEAPDKARVEFNRLYQTQQYLVSEEYDKEIGKDQDKIQEEQNKKRRKISSAGADAAPVNNALASMRQDYSTEISYAPYVNPFATYLKAIFDATDGDTENAILLLERVKVFGDNSFVEEDLKLLKSGKPIENVTYVIFESNMAPFRTEKLFETVIPIPVKRRDEYGNIHTDIIPVKIAFSWPKLEDPAQPKIHQYVINGDTRIPTEVVADMKSIVAKEFEIRWPGIKSRIFLSVLTKTVGSVYAVKAGGWVGALGASIYQEITKGTDSRTWRTLPGNFQLLRMTTPKDRKIKLDQRNSTVPMEIEIIPGDVNVIYIKQTAPESPPVHHQFKLK